MENKEFPMISAKCITFGRVNMLEESIQSFLQQDYPADKCELVIVNDYPLQKLIYDHPQVRIYNFDKTFTTIGEKENWATEQCNGNIIVQWDDDDLALPNHLQNISKYFIDGSNILHWNRGIFMNSSQITSITGLGNSGIVFSKSAWKKVGGHPLENAGYDMTFVVKLQHLGNVIEASPKDDEVSWIYAWGGRGYHMSGMGTDNDSRPNVIIRHSEYVESLRLSGEISTGDILINPNWKHDYIKMLKDYNENTSNNR